MIRIILISSSVGLLTLINLVYCMDFLTYELKPFGTISPVMLYQGSMFTLWRYGHFSADELSEQQRIQICTRGSEIVSRLEGRKVTLFRNGITGKTSLYCLLENGDETEDVTAVPAFSCPTEPPIYINLFNYMAWIMIEKKELLPSCNNLGSCSVKKIKGITDVDLLQSPLFEHAELPPFDLNKCTKRAVRSMCEKAILADNTLQNTRILAEAVPAAAIFYELKLKFESELVFAAQCPTSPQIYLQVYKDTNESLRTWIIVHEQDLPSRLFEDVED